MSRRISAKLDSELGRAVDDYFDKKNERGEFIRKALREEIWGENLSTQEIIEKERDRIEEELMELKAKKSHIETEIKEKEAALERLNEREQSVTNREAEKELERLSQAEPEHKRE